MDTNGPKVEDRDLCDGVRVILPVTILLPFIISNRVTPL